jgi:hypothetical protein
MPSKLAGERGLIGAAFHAATLAFMAPSLGNPVANTASECEAKDQRDCNFHAFPMEGLTKRLSGRLGAQLSRLLSSYNLKI